MYFIASVSPGVIVPFFTYPKSILSCVMFWLGGQGPSGHTQSDADHMEWYC